ncbi:MAG: hypothetical protein V3T05_03700 [Myxococcota bacterium]
MRRASTATNDTDDCGKENQRSTWPGRQSPDVWLGPGRLIAMFVAFEVA